MVTVLLAAMVALVWLSGYCFGLHDGQRGGD